MRTYLACLFALASVILMSCGGMRENYQNASFTKADSVTDNYLSYQDSLLQSWNVMIHDDNQKIIAMHNLLHELLATSKDDREHLEKYEEQLDQLTRIRYTQNSMANADVIEEYDFASTSLVRELISVAESKTEFGYNLTLQKLVDEIRLADERVNNYREEYDHLVYNYNYFLDANHGYLTEINSDSLKKKHLFQMVSIEDESLARH